MPTLYMALTHNIVTPIAGKRPLSSEPLEHTGVLQFGEVGGTRVRSSGPAVIG